MRLSNVKSTKNFLLSGVLLTMSLTIFLLETKPLLAGNSFYGSSTRCNKFASVPEPYPFVGILAFGILGGGYLLKLRLRKKGDCLNKSLLHINNDSTLTNQQHRQISSINLGEHNEEKFYHLAPSFELQLIEPTEII